MDIESAVPAPGEGATWALARAVEHAGHLLPAQGPIREFVHHNSLHAFEDLAFEEAIVRAGERFACEPYLPEQDYRAELESGRIRGRDVEALLARELGSAGEHLVAGLVSRLDLRCRIASYGIPDATGAALRWRLGETDVLSRLRRDAPDASRALAARGRTMEADFVRDLWAACRRAIERTPWHSHRAPSVPRRHRDVVLAALGIDSDAWIHPVLVRFLGAYLDQGLARWSMPGRDKGIHACFVDLYRQRAARLTGAWARRLPQLVDEDRAADRDGPRSLIHSLECLGVPTEEWDDYLTETALALRGFAGLVRQLELRPDRVTALALPTRLVDLLAVHLLLERTAIEHAIRADPLARGPLSTLRDRLGRRPRSGPALPDVTERAWPLLHVAQLCGLDPESIEGLSPEAVAQLEDELRAFDGTARRRVLHLAYETSLRTRLYDALALHVPPVRTSAPAFQAIFCIDEREESFRRHLEEIDPEAETFGVAGFFGVAMYHRGAGDAHPRPLCPVAIRPEHYVEEQADDDPLARRSRRVRGLLDHNIDLGSRTLVRGALVMTVLGALALIPLVLGVAFPWLARRLRSMTTLPPSRGRTRLCLDRRDVDVPLGRHAGFTVEEMATIVRRVLEDAGIREGLAPLCLVVGHGSVSLNNPHESAHDCGACGGGHGGPNARAFAQMANDPRVRSWLAARGLSIPERTWFLGAERNSSSNALELYDEDLVPPSSRSLVARARAALEETRRREAHERCRRFDAVPPWYSPALALAHVEARAADLAQPRPEYGHATNAFCIVGRRTRTEGLFLDRRAFLVSHDPTDDLDGTVLARLLAAVVPVVAGISLEYYFSRVDPTGYGCGTKLPHNITALLGVMDGALSDLRTGLPWQMVEIHEPVRLTIVVEAPVQRLQRVVRGDPRIERLVHNRWIVLACLDPDSPAVFELDPDGLVPHTPAHPLPAVVGDSIAWYGGERDHLPIAAIARPGSAVRGRA